MASQARLSTSWVRERVERASTQIERVWHRYASVRHFVVTLLIFAVSQGVHYVLEDRPFGDAFRNLEYSIIQRVLLSEFAATTSVVSNDNRLPVVIDISPAGRSDALPTDRPMLGRLVDRLIDMGADAVGVDIDFSPDDSGRFMDPHDPTLLALWNDRKIVRVGVFRRIGDSSRYWLGHPAFKNLAAGIMLPLNDPMYAYQYSSPDLATAHYRAPQVGSWGDDPDEQLLQMPTALYAVMNPRDRLQFVKDPRLKTEEVESRLTLAKYPIDYSYLLRIKTIPYEKDGDLRLYERDIRGRAVIIGDAHDLDDARTIPTEKVPVPGVLIHAAALATIRLRVLRYITGWESRGFELVLFLSAWAVMAFTHGRNPAHRPSRRWNPHSMEIMSSAAAAVVVLLVSTTFLWLTRFYWPDFLWIAAGFFLHPYFHHIKELVVVPGLKGSVRHAGPA
jgi:CHASE2 domain-containing sensor protein